MKLKPLRQILIMSKYALIGLVLQCILYNFILANETNAQKQSIEDIFLTLQMQDASIEQIFAEIANETVFSFAYNKSVTNKNSNLSVDFVDKSLADLLRYLSKNTNLSFKRVDETIHVNKKKGSKKTVTESLGSPLDFRVRVSGKVIDENGEALPGVNVVVKNTSEGAITDADGTYALDVPGDANILVFSYVGYISQEVQINGREVIDITLSPDVSALAEVVVVGYGTQKKANVTGAIVDVDTKELNQSSVSNLTNALVGRLPGLIATQRSGQPGANAATLLIRGVGTTGNSSPLIIVDGVQRDFSQLDPNEVESVTILKDASAAAIYGVRGANGVILVTTKRGSAGKPAITYSYELTSQKPIRLPKFLDSYNYAVLFNEAKRNEGKAELFTQEDLDKYRSGSSPDTHPNTDWLDEGLAESASLQQHNLSVTGGTDRLKYFVSLGYLFENGLYKNLNFERYNFRSNLDFDVTSNFRVSIDLSGRLEDRSEPVTGISSLFSGLIRLPPTGVAYYSNGLPGPGAFGGNPIEAARSGGVRTSERNIFFATLKGEYDIPFVKGLTAKAYVAVDRAQITTKSVQNRYSIFSLNNDEFDETIVGQSSVNETFFSGPAPSGSGIPDPVLTLNATLNYSTTIAERHEITGLLGVERAIHESNRFQAGRLNLVSDALPQLDFGDAGSSTTGGSAFKAARLGYLSRVTYGYDAKYLFEASFRYDASENFPSENRWGFFPSFSVGWRISEEPFLSGVDFIDNLKLRASWGQLGNDRIAQFQFLNAFNFGNDYVLGGAAVKTIRPGVVPNPDVTWETSTTTNVGFNLGLWDSKLTVEFDYFIKNTEDILEFRDLSVPTTFGASLPRQNIGEVENKGFELSASYQNSIAGIDYWVKGNYTFARNEIIFVDEPADVSDNLKRTGRPIGTLFGLKALGLFQSQSEIDAHADQGAVAPGDIKYEDINGDGTINSDDRVSLGILNAVGGQAAPEIIFALSLGASYKGFDFSAQFQGADNFFTYLSEEAAFAFFNGGKVLEEHLDRWTPDNPDATYPRILTEDSNNRLVSSYWLRDASYVRLKNLEIGYNFPEAVISKAKLNGLRVYVSGLNLFTISDLDTFDPEAPRGRGWFYPQQKSFTLGVSVQL